MSRIGGIFGSFGEPNVGIIHRPVRVKDLCSGAGTNRTAWVVAIEHQERQEWGVCYPCDQVRRQQLARPADLDGVSHPPETSHSGPSWFDPEREQIARLG